MVQARALLSTEHAAPELEAQVLGILIKHSARSTAAYDRLDESYFADARNRIIWQAVERVWVRSNAVTSAAVIAETRVITEQHAALQSRIREIHHAAPDAHMLDTYIDMLGEWATRRKAMRAIYDATIGIQDYNTEPDATLRKLESDVASIGRMGMERDELTDRDAVLDDVVTSLTTADTTALIPTRVQKLDAIIGGLKPGEMIVVAGRPGSGKSALATSLADNLAIETGTPFLLFSLEMDAVRTWGRLFAWRAKVDGLKLVRRWPLSDDERERMEAAKVQFKAAPLFVDTRGGRSIPQMKTRIRHAIAAYGVRVVAIDQANWVPVEGRNLSDRERLSIVSRSWKMIAQELGVSVLLLHQLNRDAANPLRDYRPDIEHLKGSGSFEEDADSVVLCYRPEYHGIPFRNADGTEDDSKGKGELIVAKNRDGNPDTARLAYIKRFTRWDDVAIGADDALPTWHPSREAF